MGRVYNVGAEELCPDELDTMAVDTRFVWTVYTFSAYGYEGEGSAYSFSTDGKLFFFDLSHCSCYGAVDGWHGYQKEISLDKFFAVSENILEAVVAKPIRDKVAELLDIVNLSAV